MEQGFPGGRCLKSRLLEHAAQTLVAALLLGTASGCATIDYDEPHMRPPLSNARLSPRPVTVIQIMPGDTLAGVAHRFDTSEQVIIEANALPEVIAVVLNGLDNRRR